MIKQLEFAYAECESNDDADNARLVEAPPSNEELANALKEVATFLQVQGANRFRVETYYRAVNVLLSLKVPVWESYELNGIVALEELPAIGRSISRALQQMIRGGRWPLLERLNGNDAIGQAFASVPNIGPVFAKRIHEELHIETLAELQAAAWDGRLEKLPGMGEKRLRAVRESLAGRGRFHYPLVTDVDEHDVTKLVPVAEILDVDDQYLFEVKNGTLPKVSPKNNNPTQEAWLPILHTERGDRHYTALFSNTAHAHELGTHTDWVVIYLEDDRQVGQHGRWTVITSQFGKLRSKRIVRGREKDCGEYYKQRVV